MKVVSVNISEKKGVIKQPVKNILINKNGVAGDAHAGMKNRQISLLGTESVEKFSVEAGRKVHFGEFAENITTEGLLLYDLNPLDKLVNSTVELEVTQIGKKCHGTSCAIFREVGNCVMPKEGIFCRVINGGNLQAGDTLELKPRIIKALIITLSDRANEGVYNDLSGPALEKELKSFFEEKTYPLNIQKILIPDDANRLENILLDSIKQGPDLIFTTGGTGIGPKDITPDVVSNIIDKEIPGIMELIRQKYGKENPNTLLSRSVAGVKNNTLVYSIPGNPKAVTEYMSEISKTLLHSIYMLNELNLH